MRGKQSQKRELPADYKYGSVLVTKLINYVMFSGKKTVAEYVVYSAFDIIEKETKQKPNEVFETALRNTIPAVEVKSRRVGGANYQVPVPVRGDRRYALAYRWILAAARAKKGKPMAERLAAEIMAAANNEGEAVKKRADVQRMAEANRAFAHFARH
ncbi:MAG: 30S ribosomal protein S7 [Patescibacteria group bacterium]|jgi:small subunit ribosomal protein S7